MMEYSLVIVIAAIDFNCNVYCRYPIFENPYPLSIHESPVTCCEYFADCPSDLIPALYFVGARQKRQGYSKKVCNRSGDFKIYFTVLVYPTFFLRGVVDYRNGQ